MATETFRITIDDTVFAATDSAFAVPRGTCADGLPRTLCGPLSDLVEGATITATATASEHPRHGTRWTVEKVVVEEPDSAAGRIAFLRSIKGIGQRRAELLEGQFRRDVPKEIHRGRGESRPFRHNRS